MSRESKVAPTGTEENLIEIFWYTEKIWVKKIKKKKKKSQE